MLNTLRDLTTAETIYQKRLKTVSIKIRRDYVANKDIKLNTISNPGDVHEVITSIFQGLDDDQEHVVLLVLNQAHDLIGYKLISSGTQEFTPIDCKILFRNALLLGASAIIIAHNHPSGSLEPSKHDIDVTKKIVQASKFLDVDVLDHVIYTPKGYTSLRDKRPKLFE